MLLTMSRETKKIILPVSNIEIELYTYITGGEKRAFTELLIGDIKADISGKPSDGIPLTNVYKANDKVFEMLVVSVGESKENVLSSINDLPSKDYDFLQLEINKITSDFDYQEKKTI